MTNAPAASADTDNLDFLAGGGRMGELIRAHDWRSTELGAPTGWPQSLRSALSICLHSSLPTAVYWGPGLRLFYNDAWAPIPAERHPWALGRPTAEVWADIWDIIGQQLAQVVQSREGFTTHDQLLPMDRDGVRQETYWNYSFSPIFGEDGSVAGIFNQGSETTEGVLGANAVRESEARLRRVLENMAESFVLLDRDFRIVEINEEGTRLERRSRDELVSKLYWEVWPGTEEAEQGRLYKRVMEERTPGAAEVRFAWPDGREGWFEVRAVPADHGLAIFYREVTERRLAEEQLRKNEALLSAVLDVAPVGVIIADADGRIFRDNAANRELWGVPPETTAWEQYGDWVGYWPDTGERIKAQEWGLARALLKGEVVKGELIENQRFGSGERRFFLNSAAPVCDPEGAVVAGVVFEVDVTERLATERKFRDTSRRLDAILNNTREAVFLMDDRQHCIYANAAAEKLTGYSFAEMQGRPLHDVVHHKKPDGSHYPLEECPIDRACPERAQMSGEELFVHKDGSFYPVAFTASPVLDENGQPVGTVIEARNIAEEKASEAAHREVEERYRLAARATSDAIWDWRMADGQVIWNEALHELFGHQCAETDADWWIEHIHPNDRERVSHAIHEVIDSAGTAWSAEYRFERVDGSYAHVFDRGHVLRDSAGKAIRMIGAMLDLTDRRRSEDALRDTEERLRLAVDNADIGFWDVDMINDILIWPPRTKAMFGISADVPVSMRDFYEGLHPDDLPATSAAFAAAADPAVRGLYDVEYRTIGKEDAVVRWVAARGRGVFSGEGPDATCQRVIGTAIDITDRKHAEEELRDLNERLEQRVAEEVAGRTSAEAALRQSQKMEAVGQLTGGIAHDFNNLLTIITGNVDMARRSLDNGEGARAVRALDNAYKGAERAAALTQRLLAFSRRQPLAPKPINVDRLVAGMSDLLHRALGETVRLETVSNPGLWLVEADPNQLENAIVNLAVNARDAMPDGGTLTIETANARLDDTYSAAHAEVAPGAYVVIAITDSGHGMSKETVARVFEPFFTTKEVGKGTGLGLSMVYGFVKQSGGHVKLYSEEGHGTTVKLYLPRLMSEADEEANEATAPEGVDRPGKEHTILVVEDDDDVRAYTVEILRELGYRVLEAHDGPSALRLLERQELPVDLLFTDVVMPGMSGRELADEARQLQSDIKVLYTSGYTRNAIVHGGRLDQGVEMIAKPFTYQALAEKIADVLDIGRTGRVLVVEDDATLRMFAMEALDAAGYMVDEAANAAEALGRLRAAKGRYDAVVIDGKLPDKPGEALAVEMRALHADLPLLLVSGEHAAELATRFADDRCVSVLPKPFNASKLTATLAALGVSCATSEV